MPYVFFAILVLLVAGFFMAALKRSGIAPAQVTRFGLIITLLFLVAGSVLYRYIGAPDLPGLLVLRDEKMAALKESILRSSQAVKANPNDLRAWVELGQSFVETGQMDAAANAFKQAVILSQGDPKLILAYAKALILSEKGQVSDHAKKSLEMVLLQDPGNAEARYYLAIRELQDGNQPQAMADMKALYKDLPEDSALKDQIDRQIGRKP